MKQNIINVYCILVQQHYTELQCLSQYCKYNHPKNFDNAELIINWAITKDYSCRIKALNVVSLYASWRQIVSLRLQWSSTPDQPTSTYRIPGTMANSFGQITCMDNGTDAKQILIS